MCRGIAGFLVQDAAVEVLRAVYLWSGRHYHRELLRRELWRIGRKAVEAQRHRGPNSGSVVSVRHGQSLTPG
jgi:Arc/MetJ family transcription regulator